MTRRTRHVGLRLTPLEWQLLNQVADQQRLPVSVYIRRAALHAGWAAVIQPAEPLQRVADSPKLGSEEPDGRTPGLVGL